MRKTLADVRDLLSREGVSPPPDDLPGLKVLDLFGKDVNDEDLRVLTALENLEFLSLASTHVSDSGLVLLGRLTKLKELHLDNLALLAPLVNLKNLYLGDMAISDRGLRHLTALPELEMVILWNDRITDAGLLHLHGTRKLKRVVLWETDVTADGVRSLLERFPDCEIDHEST